MRNSLSDIDCFVNFVSSKYEQVVIVAYCFGCDKILNYLQFGKNSKIASVSLVAPQDMFETIYGEDGEKALSQAVKNIKDGHACDIIDKKLFSFCDVSSETYFDMIINKKFYQFPIFSNEIITQQDLDLNLPIQLVIGELDRGVGNGKIKYGADDYLNLIAKKIKTKEKMVIPNTSHSFSQRPNTTADKILMFAYETTQLTRKRGV